MAFSAFTDAGTRSNTISIQYKIIHRIQALQQYKSQKSEGKKCKRIVSNSTIQNFAIGMVCFGMFFQCSVSPLCTRIRLRQFAAIRSSVSKCNHFFRFAFHFFNQFSWNVNHISGNKALEEEKISLFSFKLIK